MLNILITSALKCWSLFFCPIENNRLPFFVSEAIKTLCQLFNCISRNNFEVWKCYLDSENFHCPQLTCKIHISILNLHVNMGITMAYGPLMWYTQVAHRYKKNCYFLLWLSWGFVVEPIYIMLNVIDKLINCNARVKLFIKDLRSVHLWESTGTALASVNILCKEAGRMFPRD